MNIKKKALGLLLTTSLMAGFNQPSFADSIDNSYCFTDAALDSNTYCDDCMTISDINSGKENSLVAKNFKKIFDILSKSELGKTILDDAIKNNITLSNRPDYFYNSNSQAFINFTNGRYIYNIDKLDKELSDTELSKATITTAHELFHSFQLHKMKNISRYSRGNTKEMSSMIGVSIELFAYISQTIIMHDLVEKKLIEKPDLSNIKTQTKIDPKLYHIYLNIIKDNPSNDRTKNIQKFSDKVITMDDTWLRSLRMALFNSEYNRTTNKVRNYYSTLLVKNSSSCTREFSKMSKTEYLTDNKFNIKYLGETIAKDLGKVKEERKARYEAYKKLNP